MTTPTYTHITASGLLARIVCTDRDFVGYPVVALVKMETGETIAHLKADLTLPDLPAYNLTPLPPYHDFKIDEPVMVRVKGDTVWLRRYFSSVDNGRATAWNGGGTKWSSNANAVSWDECRRPTPEELESV